jgi:hypothetical protein
LRCADKLLDNSLRGKGNINFNGYSVPDTIQKGVQARPYKKVVEENVLKLIIGFDPAVFNVDMLHKICGKLGFVSRKFTKVVCLETILNAFNDLKAYEGIKANKSTNNIDSTSVRCRLLNVITSDGFNARFQMLGSRKEMAELDKGA